MPAMGSVWARGTTASGSAGGALAGSFPNPTFASTVPFWSILKPPASPSAYDDEFDNASIAAQWNAFNPGSNGTRTETAADRLTITAPSGTDKVTGMLVNIVPGVDEYNVDLGFHPFGNAVNFLQVGLIAGGSDMISAPTTADFLFGSCLLRNSDWFWELNKYAAYNSYNATDGTLADGPFCVIRWHVKESADRAGMLVSLNGQEFEQVNDCILSTASLTGTNPRWFGPAVNNIANYSGEAGARFDFFRFAPTTDRFAPIGGYVNLAKS